MTSGELHDRIERAFHGWGLRVAERPVTVILVSLSLAAVLCTGLFRIRAEFSNESFLLAGDETRAVYDAFRERYGRDDRVVVGIATQDVFDLAFLERLRAFHADVEREVPYVHEVLSLVNARSTRGVGDELVVDELQDQWPADASGIERLRERVMANPLYLDFYVSRDATMAGVLVEPYTYSPRASPDDELTGFEEAGDDAGTEEPPYLTEPENRELVDALGEVARRHAAPGFRPFVVGDEVAGIHLERISARDTARFMSLSVLLICLFLVALFRRVTAALLPLGVVIVAVLATFGTMGLLDLPFSTVTQIVPSFLIAVGICDSVHVLSYFYRALSRGASRQQAVAEAVGGTGLAVTLTSLTTAASLSSFVTAEIRPVVHLGVLSPIGVLLALFFSLTLLPAALAVVPLRAPRGPADEGVAAGIGAALTRLADFATAHPRRILLAAVLLLLAALPLVQKVRFANDLLDWFWPGDPVRESLLAVDERFRGIATLEVLVDTGRENGLYDPETLRRIERAGAYAESLRVGPVETGKATSLVDVVHEIHQALNGGDPAARRIPDDPALVAQELLLFENSGSDDLEEVTDTNFREARLSIRVRWNDGMHYVAFLDELERRLVEILGPELPITVTGSVAISNRGFSVLFGSLVRSYALALAVITPMMMLLLASFRRGLLAMIPNVMPVYLTLALMGLADVPMNLSTLLMGSVVIGLAVDDTIHFVHGFDRARAGGLDAQAAVHHTFERVGPALLVTSLVLAGSFVVFLLADFVGVFHFGLLVSFAVVVAFLSDVLVAPALLVLDGGAGMPWTRAQVAETLSPRSPRRG